MWGFQGVGWGGGASLTWRRLGLPGRKRFRPGWVGGLAALGCGTRRADSARLDALVAAEPFDGSEIRHEDDHGVEQCLRDAAVGQAKLGVVDAIEGGLLEVAVAALVLAAQPGPGLLPQRGEQGVFLPPLGQHGAWDSDALPGADVGVGAGVPLGLGDGGQVSWGADSGGVEVDDGGRSRLGTAVAGDRGVWSEGRALPSWSP